MHMHWLRAGMVLGQVFALENYDTAEMISRQLGQQTIDITSRGATESGQGWSTSQTTSNTGRALLTPDEVRLVGAHDNQQIVFMSGRRPWKGPRICHFNDSEFTGLWDEDTRPTT
jgi:type IV secretory pathway TraG/TraD family ATPase VirD4